jgi:hypothetical protein
MLRTLLVLASLAGWRGNGHRRRAARRGSTRRRGRRELLRLLAQARRRLGELQVREPCRHWRRRSLRWLGRRREATAEPGEAAAPSLGLVVMLGSEELQAVGRLQIARSLGLLAAGVQSLTGAGTRHGRARVLRDVSESERLVERSIQIQIYYLL